MHTLSLFERLLSAGCPGTSLPSCLSATIKLFDLALDGLPKFHFCTLPVCSPLSVSGQMTAQSHMLAFTALLCRTMNLHAVLQLTSLCNRLWNLLRNILCYLCFRFSPQRIFCHSVRPGLIISSELLSHLPSCTHLESTTIGLTEIPCENMWTITQVLRLLLRQLVFSVCSLF